jgi:DNA-binding FadR family transcriptional regulator
MFRPAARRKLFRDVADQLADAIRSGALAAGAELPGERALTATFGVGRPAVREALRVLEAEGMVEVRHGRRARVVPATSEALTRRIESAALGALAASERFVDDLKEARLVLELATSRRAAERATDADIARLMDALEANRRAIPDRDAYLATDIAFHRTIAAIAGNAVFEAASAAMLSWLARARVDAVHVEGANLLSHDEHARIARAIAARDPDAAAAAMEAHQRRTHALYGRLAARSPRRRGSRSVNASKQSGGGKT